MGNDWLCINCGTKLGEVAGGELTPAVSVPSTNVRTRGPNLVVVCPNCGATKQWYTADPVVRAMYQLVDALATALAKRVLNQLSIATLPPKEKD